MSTRDCEQACNGKLRHLTLTELYRCLVKPTSLQAHREGISCFTRAILRAQTASCESLTPYTLRFELEATGVRNPKFNELPVYRNVTGPYPSEYNDSHAMAAFSYLAIIFEAFKFRNNFVFAAVSYSSAWASPL